MNSAESKTEDIGMCWLCGYNPSSKSDFDAHYEGSVHAAAQYMDGLKTSARFNYRNGVEDERERCAKICQSWVEESEALVTDNGIEEETIKRIQINTATVLGTKIRSGK